MIPPFFPDLLNRFTPISLQEMDAVKLMTRTDVKYSCHIDQLPEVLEQALTDYQILEIDHRRLMGYESLYFDTPGFEMYLKHHNRNLNRHKVRIRTYTDSDETFLEIKFKKNTGTTVKQRIPYSRKTDLHDPAARTFLVENTPYTPEDLVPKVFSSFRRVTLVNKTGIERITIDVLPGWWFNEQIKEIPYLVIIEVKSGRINNIEGFPLILRDARIHRNRLSKYCTGVNLLYPEVKYNRFKAKILLLKKLDKTQNYAHIFAPLL